MHIFNFKWIFSLLATLIMFLGVAGMITPKQSPTPIAEAGMGKGLEQPAVLPPDPGSPTLSQENFANRNKFAVIIGIVYDNYELGTVTFADKDAESTYNLLVGRLGFPRENVIMLRNSEATRENIFGALAWLSGNPDINSESDVVFFYSGHGVRSLPNVGLNIPTVQSAYALVPFDFMKYDYKMGQGLLWDNDLRDFLGRIQAGRMWINIDSCSAGGFNQPGITGPGRIVTMSSQADQLSSEIPEVQRGVLQQFMVEEGIARGLSIEEAFAAAAPRAFQNSGQNPQIADEYAGNMDLGKSPLAPIN